MRSDDDDDKSIVMEILDEMPVFYNLSTIEKREVLIIFLQIVRNLDDETLIKAWEQSIARTRLFFKLLEECLMHFEHRKPADGMLVGSSSRSVIGDGPSSPKYSDRLSPAINHYMSEAARQEVRGTPDNGYLWQRVNSQLSSPSQPYSLREALAQAQSSRIGASALALRESLHPILRQKLFLSSVIVRLFQELWEENLSAAVSLQVLEVSEKFSRTAAMKRIATDYGKLECIASIFMNVFSRNQPLSFWKALFPVFNSVFELHGATLMARENDRFLKQIAFHLLRLAVFRNDNIRKRAVIGLQILIRSSFSYFMQTGRLRVMLTITLSELMSEVQVTQMKPDGTLEESGEARRLRNSLEEMANEAKSSSLLVESGLPGNALVTVPEGSAENRWSWSEVKFLSESLLMALDASLEHALLGSVMNVDRYAAAESFYKLAMAFAPVPDLHIMWLLHLCEAHQEMQSWAEAAQCAVAVAGVVMQGYPTKLGWEREECTQSLRPVLRDATASSHYALMRCGLPVSRIFDAAQSENCRHDRGHRPIWFGDEDTHLSRVDSKNRKNDHVVLVNSPRGSLFLESIDTSDSTDSIKIFSLFKNIIEKIGPENVVQVVTDNVSENVKAGSMIMGVFLHIYWTPCATHCVNLIFGDIFKQRPFQGVFTMAIKVHSYIVQRPLLLTMMRRFTNQRNLVKPGKTRFATAFLTLHSTFGRCEAKPSMGYIYEAMTGTILNPTLYYKREDDLLNKNLMMGFHICIANMVVDEDMQDRITDQISSYQNAEGIFGIATAIRQRGKKSPDELVFDGDTNFTWSVVAEASGVDERLYGLRVSTSSSYDKGKEVATTLDFFFD
ncbi:hypothetical protein FXO38_28979 [Capsicum annuum]|nr:hypothetical protein FXO38_28979 [Capsicum annuum]KAF3646395.1 hypothetical protein FXO37_20476 [Capsicum annuum]